MPEVYARALPGNTRIRLWEVTESIDELTAQYPNADYSVWENTRLEKRKREWLGRQFLMQSEDPPVVVHYAATGKPLLNQGFISLSHSEDLVAMVLSDKPVGVDIQTPVEQIARIRTKFCRQDELDGAAIAPNPLEFLTRIWSAKEALFKIYGSDVDFRAEMAFACEEQDHIFLLKSEGMARHDLFVHRHGDMLLTVCLDLGAD